VCRRSWNRKPSGSPASATHSAQRADRWTLFRRNAAPFGPLKISSSGSRWGTRLGARLPPPPAPRVGPRCGTRHLTSGCPKPVRRLQFGELSHNVHHSGIKINISHAESPQGVRVCVIQPGSISTTLRHRLERDTKAWLDALPEDGRARYGRALQAMAISIGQHAAHGSAPDVVARAVVHTLTSRRPRTRYPVAAGAKRLLFMRRALPDRVLDRMVMRTVGLRSASRQSRSSSALSASVNGRSSQAAWSGSPWWWVVRASSRRAAVWRT
jgi:hypothetical protein